MREPIDQGVLEKLYADLGADDASVRALIATFLEEAPQLVDTIRHALARNEPVIFERAAHSLKSASATVGALELSGTAKELELAARKGDLRNCEAAVQQLPALLAGVRDGLEHWHER
ncbi:MAG: Hpt domain-containing protein [Euryarchaeota archaeon]|nr:Hpt domain-containing protein [Euryarchaeota archaeon]